MPCQCSRCSIQSQCRPKPTPLHDVTAIYLSGDLPIVTTDRAIPLAQLQLPGVANAPIKIDITALVDSSFIPVHTTTQTFTDSDGYLTVSMPEGTRYVHFRLLFDVAGQHMEANCYEPEGTLNIWEDNLNLRAALLRANRWAIDRSGYDHKNAKQQAGPCKASRAEAIVHLAIYEAVNSIDPHSASQFAVPTQPSQASLEAAIAQATHDTLIWLFDAQTALIDAELVTQLASLPNGVSKTLGIAAGAAAASAVIANRSSDGGNSYVEELWTTYATNTYGTLTPPLPNWAQDPVVPNPFAIGSKWADVVPPFVLTSADQFPVEANPLYTGSLFSYQLGETKVLGGDGTVTPTVRTEDATEAGYFWAFDG